MRFTWRGKVRDDGYRRKRKLWQQKPPSTLVVGCVFKAVGYLTQRTLYEIADYVRNDYGSIGTQTVERALLALVDRGFVEEHPADYRDWKTYTRRRT